MSDAAASVAWAGREQHWKLLGMVRAAVYWKDY